MEWNRKHIEELVKAKEKESNSLEFKRAESLYNSYYKGGSKKDDLSKDISAMANSNGGALIYGIQEYSSGINKCKAECISFVDGELIMEEWLEDVINTRISPRIKNIKIFKIEFEGNNCVFVIDIPKGVTDHQAQDKRYYRRFNFQSVPMDDWEIKDLINRGNKPEIDCMMEVKHLNLGFETLITSRIEVSVKIFNKGMVAANYVNCFIEFDKRAKKYIVDESLAEHSDFIQLMFYNKHQTTFTVGNQSHTIASSNYDPLLPMVFTELGSFKVKKGFLENEFSICCKIATESTYNEFHFKSNEISR